jgi:hypothetical protein
MSKWHLYSEFKNGLNVGGRIQYLWLFGAIGLFVLLLAGLRLPNGHLLVGFCHSRDGRFISDHIDGKLSGDQSCHGKPRKEFEGRVIFSRVESDISA